MLGKQPILERTAADFLCAFKMAIFHGKHQIFLKKNGGLPWKNVF